MVNAFLTWVSRISKEEEDKGFISAQNPNYQKLSPEENEKRMLQLSSDLEKIGIPKDKVKVSHFVDKKNGYEEDSFYVENISPSELLRLAKQYGQAEVLTDAGLINVESMQLTTPVKKVLTGDEALAQDAYSYIEDVGPVAYQF